MPGVFWIQERRIDLTEILDWWPARDYRYVKIKRQDDGISILRQDLNHGEWELTLSEWPD